MAATRPGCPEPAGRHSRGAVAQRSPGWHREWDASVAATSGVLAKLEPARMAQTTERTGRTTTVAQILLHVTHHNATHMGQIVWIAKMLAPGAVDDLWMKMRTK